MPADLVSGEGPPPGLQRAACLLGPHVAFLLCMSLEREGPLVSLPLLIRSPALLGEDPRLLTSFNLNDLPKVPFLNTVPLGFRVHSSAHVGGFVNESCGSASSSV